MDIDTTLELLGLLINLTIYKGRYLTPIIEEWDIL